MPTREEILAEIQRRGLSPAPPMSDIQAEIERRGLPMPAVFTQTTEQPQEPKGFTGASILEPLATMASGAVAEPAAGIAGLLRSLVSGPEVGAETIQKTREALTFKPRTEKGQQGLESLGTVLAPVGKAIQSAEQWLGDETFEATGSPALAAAATTLPTVMMEVLGVAAGKGAIRRTKNLSKVVKDKSVRKAIVASAPDIDQIKNASRAVYSEIDNAGIRLPQNTMKVLDQNIKQALEKANYRPKLAPKTKLVLDEIKREINKPQSLTNIDQLRQVAQSAATKLEPNDLRLTGVIVDEIDNFLDTTARQSIKNNRIIPKYKVARDLWGRARRSELINEAFEAASLPGKNFEKNLVSEFSKILKNKKQVKFFKPEEIEVMKQVIQSPRSEKILTAIGRFGYGEGGLTNIVQGGAGAVAGAALFGTPGAIAVPIIGQVSGGLAKKLTRSRGAFADAVIRAGNNADDIARAYISKVPKAQRSAAELSELFLRPDISVEKLAISNNKFLREAAEIAKGRKALGAAAIGGGVGVTKETTKPDFFKKLKNIKLPENLPDNLIEVNGKNNRLQRQLSGITAVGP